MIRGEHANDVYDTAFMCALFEEEGGGLFDVRQSILGHLQQGGDPSPFDRIQATKLARLSVQHLATDALTDSHGASFIGIVQGTVQFSAFEDFLRLVDAENRRPRQQWWLGLRRINDALARPAAKG
jgi:6-phosphofructokinase 1